MRPGESWFGFVILVVDARPAPGTEADALRRWLIHLPAVLAALLLLVAAGGWLATRDAQRTRIVARPASAADRVTAIDTSLLDSARQLAPLVASGEEQELARQALRLADHELDQAFEMALREALEIRPPQSGPLREASRRITDLEAAVTADEKSIAQLTRAVAGKTESGDGSAEAKLQLTKAQLALDQDELDDARQDLARKGGDEHGRLQTLAEAHQAAQKAAPPFPKELAEPDVDTFDEQVREWWWLNGKARQLAAARQQALNRFALLARSHAAMESSGKPQPATDADPDAAAAVERLRSLSSRTKTMSDLDRRTADTLQLGDVYRRWSAMLAARQRLVLHRGLASLSWMLGIVLTVLLANRLIRHLLGRSEDRRRLHQQRSMARLAVLVVGGLLILLIIYGPPRQTPTIIGLATAGLTVAMKDFIVAFFGWFVLMGKNGLRLGDWVEINGVGGEVIQLGIFRTYLLEMGNWGTTGHPTGRRVGFSNSFAVEGRFFNFSTAGQWMWDEMTVSLPKSDDPYGLAEAIRKMVESATTESVRLAELDWERVTRETGVQKFSARPAVEVRPSGGGLEAVVRYITRGPQRYEVKSRLFESLVELLRVETGAGKAAPED